MIVIKVAAVEKVGPSEMRLARIRTQTNDGFQRSIRRRKTGGGVIQTKEIQVVVRGGKLEVSEVKIRVARDGLLDCLSSDYVPHSLLHGAFLLRELAGWSLARAVRAVTLTPARLVQLDDRGEIAPGKRADFVRVRELEGVPVPMMTWREGARIA